MTDGFASALSSANLPLSSAMQAEQLQRNCFRDIFRKPSAFFRIADQTACEGISFRRSFRKASAFFRNADQMKNCRKYAVPAESHLL